MNCSHFLTASNLLCSNCVETLYFYISPVIIHILLLQCVSNGCVIAILDYFTIIPVLVSLFFSVGHMRDNINKNNNTFRSHILSEYALCIQMLTHCSDPRAIQQ